MAKAGDELLNSVTGLRTVFRKTAEETSGELLQVDWIGERGWTTGPDHVHPRQEERFEVLSGRLGLRVGGVERVHSAGDVVVAPAGAQDRESLRDPGGAGARREDQQGGGSQEPAAVGGHPARIRGGDLFRPPPLAVQRVILGALAFIGRQLGYRAEYLYHYARQSETSLTVK